MNHEALVVRRKDFIDNAIPSGNSMTAEALLQTAALLGNQEHRQEAARIFLLMEAAMARQPTGFGRMLGALDQYLAPSMEIAIVGDPDDEATQVLLREVRNRYLPHAVVALKKPYEESPLPVFEGRSMDDGKPTANVCENYVCQLPVTTPEELRALLA